MKDCCLLPSMYTMLLGKYLSHTSRISKYILNVKYSMTFTSHLDHIETQVVTPCNTSVSRNLVHLSNKMSVIVTKKSKYHKVLCYSMQPCVIHIPKVGCKMLKKTHCSSMYNKHWKMKKFSIKIFEKSSMSIDIVMTDF